MRIVIAENLSNTPPLCQAVPRHLFQPLLVSSINSDLPGTQTWLCVIVPHPILCLYLVLSLTQWLFHKASPDTKQNPNFRQTITIEISRSQPAAAQLVVKLRLNFGTNRTRLLPKGHTNRIRPEILIVKPTQSFQFLRFFNRRGGSEKYSV